MEHTRDRIVAEALRLFAERGYAGTSVAAIEEAAGLSPHSGALYTHFPSKEAVVTAAVERAVDTAETGFTFAPMLELGDLRSELVLIARASMMLLDSWRDLVRVLLKESDRFTPLTTDVRKRLFEPSYRFLAGWLATKASAAGYPERDFEAVAGLALGAIEHHWIMVNLFDGAPLDVDDDRFVNAWADAQLAALGAS